MHFLYPNLFSYPLPQNNINLSSYQHRHRNINQKTKTYISVLLTLLYNLNLKLETEFRNPENMDKIFIFIILILVFLLSCFFVFQLLNQRNEIKTQYILDKEEQKKKKLQYAIEGLSFLSSDKTSESKNIATQIAKQYKQLSTYQMTTQYNDFPLNNLFIFSSWNTACSGKYVSTEQITNVIASGCRMVQFTVSNFGSIPTIFGDFSDNANQGVLLEDALQTCMNKSFTYSLSIPTNTGNETLNLSNYNDPLIVMISFKYFTTADLTKYNETKNTKPNQSLPTYDLTFFNKCATSIKTNFNNRLYRNTEKRAMSIDKTVLKSQLNQKVVVVIDITGLSNSQLAVFETSRLYKNYTNLVTGSKEGVSIYPLADLITKPRKTVNTTDIKKNLVLALNETTQNPSLIDFVKCSFYQNCQMIPLLFYHSDFINVMQYFQQNNSAFLSQQTINNEVIKPNSIPVMF